MSDDVKTLSGLISIKTARRLLATMYVYECTWCDDVFAMRQGGAHSDNIPDGWVQCDKCNRFACKHHANKHGIYMICDRCVNAAP